MKIRVIFLLFFIIIALFLGIPLVGKMIEREEKRECLAWKKQASEIKNFYLTSWQKEQCDWLGIEIAAPVK